MNSKSLSVRTNFLVLCVVAIYLIKQLAAQLTLGQSWLSKNLYIFLIGIQIFIIFLPGLFFLYARKLRPAVFLRIRKLSAAEALLIVLMAATSSFIASVLNAFAVFALERLGTVRVEGIPAPESISELWLQVFVFALLPAICEEFFSGESSIDRLKAKGLAWRWVYRPSTSPCSILICETFLDRYFWAF